jgi:hypothetical protein
VLEITVRDYLVSDDPGLARHHRAMAVRSRRVASVALAAALLIGPAGSSAPSVSAWGPGSQMVTRCGVLPASNVWNRRIDSRPVRPDSATLMARMNATSSHLHPDFGSFEGYGIPFNVVSAATPRNAVRFEYDDESDAGPYPIPASPLVEGAGAGGDRHILMVDMRACRLWELFAAEKVGGAWTAGSGAIFDLRSNALRPDGWTSADAAGLPIYPGLVRYGEVAAGAINHAIRFTVPVTRKAHIYPARHDAGSKTTVDYPPMGLRLRLKAGVDISGYGPQSRVILTALKRYGMILADNGSGYYISGAPDPRWDDDDLHGLHGITGSMFEVVDTTGFVNGS